MFLSVLNKWNIWSDKKFLKVIWTTASVPEVFNVEHSQAEKIRLKLP